MARKKEQESGRFDLGLKDLLDDENVKEFITWFRDMPPILMALLMVLSALIISLMFILFFKVPIAGIVLTCLGVIFYIFYKLAKKISTYDKNKDDDRYY